MTPFFTHLPELHSPRLLLRPLEESDAADVFAFTADPAVTQFLSWNPHADQEVTLAFLRSVTERYAAGLPAQWAIVWKETGTVTGISGFVEYLPDHARGEIAFIMSRNWQGRGIMTEANRMILQAGFDLLHLHRIQAKAEESNHASRKVLGKIGMTEEGRLRDFLRVKGIFRTYLYYSILKDEFNPSHSTW
jgi:ribosomal-protein-alanine N-acetyltransferase